MDKLNQDSSADLSPLESPQTTLEPTTPLPSPVTQQPSGQSKPDSADGGNSTVTPPQRDLNRRLRQLFARFNIYLLIFLLLLILSGAGGVIFYLQSSRSITGNNAPSSQSLSQDTLNQLSTNDINVGEPKHTLNVQSNTVFGGHVLVRSNLQVAGTLQVGSNVAINGVRITGNSVFDDAQITKSLSVSGNSSLQGQLSVQKSLIVNGGGTFLGAVSAPSIATDSLQLTGNLKLTRHIAPGGATPSRSGGAGLGGGGTVSVSGSDTAGSVSINTGSSPGAGCFVTVTFAVKFDSTPHVVITPVGSSAAGLGYYINRSTSDFSICTTTTPPANASLGFDYLAFD